MKRWLPSRGTPSQRRAQRLHLPAPTVLTLLFLGLVIVGTLALQLPFATNAPLTWLQAAFTATSAVTVTGLVVVDTASHFTTFGQAVILLLIQLGGLGLMTFAVMTTLLLGQRLSLRQSVMLGADLNQTSLGGLAHLIRVVLAVVLTLEGIGTLALALRWVPEYGLAHGLWLALFHAVSAFNNAGFALWPDNLGHWVGDPVINVVVPTLFILGGLGFNVLSELRERRPWRRLTLHSRLMLLGTAILIVWSVVATAWLEWDNPATLGGLAGTGERLWAAWFQGVTTRTAGFNTVDLSGITDATALTYMSLMFVGGGSTSTAGGIKVSTLMVLIGATIAFLRRRREPSMLGRRISGEDVLKVLSLTFMSLLLVMLATFVLVMHHPGAFLPIAFEVTSAFGTVGLSQGITPELDALGQCLIMAVMFIGRLGPLALGFVLATPATARIRYPHGNVVLG